MKKKQKGNAAIIWGIIIFVVAASALVISPMFTMDRTKVAAIENINDKYNDEFIITYSNLSKTPFKDSFHAIVQSKVTGASYNATFVDGKGDIPDYESETYLMTYNTLAEELFQNSIAITYSEDKNITVRIITTEAINESQLAQFEQQVKEQYTDVTLAVETLQVSAEVYEQLSTEIPSNYQRSVIAQEANFDSFEPVVNKYTF